MTFVVYKTVPPCNLYSFTLTTVARHSGDIHSQAVRWSQYEDLEEAMGDEPRHTGLFSICCLLFRPFLMWLFNALESRGFKSSKLHNSSEETDMTAPQLSNSPQYWTMSVYMHRVRSSREDVTYIWRTEYSD